MDPNLLNYIKENLDKGVSQDQIRQSLITSGWQSSDIDAAFLQLNSEQQPKPPQISLKEQNSFFNPKFLIAAVVLALLLTAGGSSYFFFFKGKLSSNENQQTTKSAEPNIINNSNSTQSGVVENIKISGIQANLQSHKSSYLKKLVLTGNLLVPADDTYILTADISNQELFENLSPPQYLSYAYISTDDQPILSFSSRSETFLSAGSHKITFEHLFTDTDFINLVTERTGQRSFEKKEIEKIMSDFYLGEEKIFLPLGDFETKLTDRPLYLKISIWKGQQEKIRIDEECPPDIKDTLCSREEVVRQFEYIYKTEPYGKNDYL